MAKVVWPIGQYRTLQKCHMPVMPGQFPSVVEAEKVVLFDGVPGAHLQPLDQQAHENMAAWQGNRQPKRIGGGTKPVPPAEQREDLDDLLDETPEEPPAAPLPPTAPHPFSPPTAPSPPLPPRKVTQAPKRGRGRPRKG